MFSYLGDCIEYYLCIHRFVKSNPERGYHDHPWNKALSFILCGSYQERILRCNDPEDYEVYHRNRWTFNYLDGQKSFHRVKSLRGKMNIERFRCSFSGKTQTCGLYLPFKRGVNIGGWFL